MEIRKARQMDAAGIASVHVNTWRTAYRDIVDIRYLRRMSTEASAANIKRMLSDSGLISLVAEVDGQIVGFLTAGRNRNTDIAPEYQGEVYGLYVSKEYANSGIGTRLLAESEKEFRSKGITSVCVLFLAGNSAEKFYYKHGGRYKASIPYRIGGDFYLVHCYGWNILPEDFEE